MLDIEVARAALVSYLASYSTWDEEAEKLIEDFTKTMLDGGLSETAAIQELVLAGIARRPAKQVVASVSKKLGLPSRPGPVVRILSRTGRRFVESRLTKKAYTYTVRCRYLILALIIAGIGWLLYDAIRYKMTMEEQMFFREVQDELAADSSLDNAWLHETVSKSYLAVTKYLIRKGADVNGTNAQGWAPLHLVHSTKVAKVLLENGADPNIRAGDGGTPLHMQNDPSIVRMLIRSGADVNATDQIGRTPLDACWSVSDVPRAQVLMQNNARVGTGQGAKLINRIAQYDEHHDCLAALLKAGANPNAPVGLTPLHAAVVGNAASNVESLLRHGADINAKVPSGVFAGPALEVMMAEFDISKSDLRGGDEYVKGVIRRHDVTMIEGMTALEIAEKFQFTQIVKLLRDGGSR